MDNLARKAESTPLYDFQAIINENIRICLIRHSMKQTELGELLGMTSGGISLKMRGKREWGLNELAKVASVFGITPWELVTPSRDYENSQAHNGLASVLKLPRLDSNQRPSD